MDGWVRLRLDVAYDGTDFSGWAIQPGRRTVQGEIESALCRILRLTETSTTCAGRTDAGVHARGQVCHVDVPASVAESVPALTVRLARVLPSDLRVRRVAVAPAGFDARFAAEWRRYAYRVCDEPTGPDPLRRREVLAWRRRLDMGRMNDASRRLCGEHDFAAYCRRREGASTVRTLRELSWERRSDGVLEARVVADAFCHNMVRALVGSMLAVGEGRFEPDEPRRILDAAIRDSRVLVVPPHGLTLEEVGYPDDGELAAQAARSRTVRGRCE
ncbi:MAG TPA: tRNA pseudouridine(38-40) synthase TruA [Nocardioidaceae bacterium]|nr:tRNA pseudouridine(38-40) synthase TruA [Nocardioidaceae bacterium]